MDTLREILTALRGAARHSSDGARKQIEQAMALLEDIQVNPYWKSEREREREREEKARMTEHETSGRARGLLDPLRNIDLKIEWVPDLRCWRITASDGSGTAIGSGNTQEEATLDLISVLMATNGALHQRLTTATANLERVKQGHKTPVTHPDEFHPDGYPHEEMGG